MSLDQLRDARGTPVFASDGDKIGAVEELFYDEATGRPEWIGIGTGFFGTKRVLVPAARAEMRGEGIYVPYDKNQVKDSPDIDSDEISEATEQELAAYYGLEYSQQRSETGLPEGRRESQRTGADEESVVRHEEEMQVGTRGVETGRARLRKWVETEPVQMDVELQRETARVTREQIDRPVGDAAFQDEEVEVPLRAEEPVVAKKAVAKERVGLEKDVATERETVRGDVRKERIDVEGDDERLDR